MNELPTNQIICGDCIEEMRKFPADFFDSEITDAPYELGFMGRQWDASGIAYNVEMWKECLRVAKPGAFLLCFGGTRTFHRLACAIEDVGWQIRDCMMWLYGSGFPKSHDISKAIDKAAGQKGKSLGIVKGRGSNSGEGRYNWNSPDDKVDRRYYEKFASATDLAQLWNGWGTALKPAWEPIIVAMKPLDGTFAQNAEKWGVAGLWIDGGRIGTNAGWSYPHGRGGKGCFGKESLSQNLTGPKQATQGRWPANLILDEEAAGMLDKQSGISKSPIKVTRGNKRQQKFGMGRQDNVPCFGDSGGASRFFYCAKASKKERGKDNKHPTVKPLALMEYLCNLTKTPDGGVVLDPFGGSGTTALACIKTGRKYVLIEKEMEYCEIAKQRVKAIKNLFD